MKRQTKRITGIVLGTLIIVGLLVSIRVLAQQGYINYNFGTNQVFSSMRINGGLWLRAKQAVTNTLPGFGDAVVEGKVIGQEDQSIRFCPDAAQGCASVSGTLGFQGDLKLERQGSVAQTVDAADITASLIQARGTSVEFGGTGTQVNTCIDATTGAGQSCAQGQLLANTVTAPRIESANGITIDASSSQINFAQGLSIPADTVCKIVTATDACPTNYYTFDAGSSGKRTMQSNINWWHSPVKSIVNEPYLDAPRLCCNAEIKGWPAFSTTFHPTNTTKIEACTSLCNDIELEIKFTNARPCEGVDANGIIRFRWGNQGKIFTMDDGVSGSGCPEPDDGVLMILPKTGQGCSVDVWHLPWTLDVNSGAVKITSYYRGYLLGTFSSTVYQDTGDKYFLYNISGNRCQ